MGRGENKEKPATWREHLWMAVLIAILLVAWLALGRVATSDANDFLKGKGASSGGYIRREKKPPLSPARFVGQTAAAYSSGRKSEPSPARR